MTRRNDPGDHNGRLPAGPLIAAVSRRYGSLRAAGVNESRALYRMRRTGLTEDQADRWAVRFGFHPSEIWADWPPADSLAEAS